MQKVIRNTTFTVVALLATAFGVGWSKQLDKQVNPVVIGEAVLTSPLSEENIGSLPLELEFGRDYVKLGQYQETRVKTAPFAELDVVTIYPSGSINNPQTLKAQANEAGEYRLKFKLNDFHHLGVFQVVVRASLGAEASEISGRFALQTWIQDDLYLGNDDYIYPIVP